MNLGVARFLEDVSGRYAAPYFAAVQDAFVAVVTGNKPAFADARDRLNEVTSATFGIGEVLGASLILRDAAAIYADDGATMRADRGNLLVFAAAPVQAVLPHVTLTEALDHMVASTPVTIRRAAERTAQRVAELYGEGRVVAFARSAEAAVTHAAHEFIARAFAEGVPEGEAGKRLAMEVNEIRKRSAAWSEGYARMVFRTNVNTAITAGRFRQVQDQMVRRVFPAMVLNTVGDSDTRPNHQAADGIVLTVDNPEWARIAPPLGYNCRCRVFPRSLPMLMAQGRISGDGSVIQSRIPPEAHPDPGFRHGGRPDLFLAGKV